MMLFYSQGRWRRMRERCTALDPAGRTRSKVDISAGFELADIHFGL